MNKTANDYRRSELAQIHIAKKSLGLDDDTYRNVLQNICSVTSSADLDSKGRFKLIAHFKSLGWNKSAPQKRRNNNDPQDKKIWSLWYQLYDAKKTRSKTAPSLRAYCKSQMGLEDIRFLIKAQKNDLIERMKQWLSR